MTAPDGIVRIPAQQGQPIAKSPDQQRYTATTTSAGHPAHRTCFTDDIYDHDLGRMRAARWSSAF